MDEVGGDESGAAVGCRAAAARQQPCEYVVGLRCVSLPPGVQGMGELGQPSGSLDQFGDHAVRLYADSHPAATGSGSPVYQPASSGASVTWSGRT